MSISLHGPNTGGLLGSGRVCPLGRRIGVPETTMEEARPWYPTGRWSLGGGACAYDQSSRDKTGVLPVWHESILWPSEHSSHICSMFSRGVEVSVVTCVSVCACICMCEREVWLQIIMKALLTQSHLTH